MKRRRRPTARTGHVAKSKRSSPSEKTTDCAACCCAACLTAQSTR
jgi:hypothetical protein